MRSRIVLLVVALTATLFIPQPASAEPTWAAADVATVHPGVQTVTEGAQCTANFVFFDANNDVYIGQSAHCAGTGGATETNGCDSGSLPLGTPVSVDGADMPGELVYSSWLTMQDPNVNESDENTCDYNDFALVKLNPIDYDVVNPSVPFWGGPTSVGATSSLGDKVYSYGNSSLRFGVSTLSPKEGYSLGQAADGWTHDVYTATPGIPGDSGSAFLSADGAALGTLSTVALAPFPASNGVGDLAHEFDYAVTHSGISGLQLALGTEAFEAGLLP
ncbi:MAG: serine protease [Actinomycetota bacterium]